jgi:hypothetical protein
MSKPNTIWIFAYEHSGEFAPEELIATEEAKEEMLGNLEYIDVIDNKYQLWEHPSGKIYEIHSDREVIGPDKYSVPRMRDRTVWLPVLVYSNTDEVKVKNALLEFNL